MDRLQILQSRPDPSEEFVRDKLNIKTNTMTRKQLLNDLFKKYKLNAEDTFQHKHYNIITRSGIDKIQGLSSITINYDMQHLDLKAQTCCIKATGTKDDKVIQTFGESSPENNRNSYPVAIAEKRAMSRIVLKLCGFYELGVFGEDESDDFKKQN